MYRCLINAQGLEESALHQEMQIKTALKSLLISVRMASSRKETKDPGEEIAEQEPFTLLVGYKLFQTPWKSVWKTLKSLKTEPPSESALLPLSVYPK